MGLYHPGVFGPFAGKVGSVVAANHRGLNVVRNLGRKSNKARTEKQAQVTGMFGFTGEFLSPLVEMIKVGYGNTDTGLTPLNKALKYHIDYAVTGLAPNYVLDYPKVRLSKLKNLAETYKPKALAEAEQTVKLSWELDPVVTTALGTDQLYAVLYNPAKHRSIVSGAGIVRSALSVALFVPFSFVGEKVHCFLFFASEDKKRVSDTAYLGEVTILA